jgi:actin-like ATPase involved in cell morphogenesis
MEASIAANIEDGGARQIRRQRRSNVFPLYVGKVAQKMMGRSPHTIQIDIVKPISHGRNAACEFLLAI